MATPRKSAPKGPKKAAPSRPKAKFHIPHPRLVGLAAALVVLLVAAYIIAGLKTVSSYQSRLAAGSFNFTGSFTFNGQDFLSPMDSNMAFSGTYAANASTQPSASASFIGNWAGREYSGATRLAAGRLYFNLSGPTMPVIRYRQGSFLLPLEPGQWYSAKADESLYDNLCAHTQPSSLQGKLELYRTIKSLKLMPSPWVNFWSQLSGTSATHLSATLSGDQLAGIWNAVQKASPPGCSDPNTLGITADDLKHVTANVDLISAHNGSADRLTISLADKTLGANAAINLTTSGYGQASPAPAPANATDINAIYARLGSY